MIVRHFADTDTVLIEFSNEPVDETIELSESLYLDIDAKGNPVSLTIEHAKENANIKELSYMQMDKTS